MNKKSICLLLAGLMILPGCMRVPTYKRRSLGLCRNNFNYTHTEDGVTVCVKRLNNPEKDYLFNGRAVLDTEVMYVSIYNLSSDDYTISPDGIGITQIAYHDIQKAMKKTSTVARFSGAAVSGLVGASGVAGMHVLHGLVPFFYLIISIATIPFFVGGTIFGYVFFAHGIKSAVMNSRINKDLKEKILHEKMAIASGAHYEGLIFVKSSDYMPHFAIMMNERNQSKKLTFAVDLYNHTFLQEGKIV